MLQSKSFSSRDITLVALLLVVIASAWVYLNNKSHSSVVKKSTQFGKVLKVSGGEGKHLMASDFFWSSAQDGQAIGINDSFMTGPDTTAEIEIGNNKIILRPNTLIKFVKEDVVRFNDGEIVLLGSDLKVKTDSAVHKVTGEVTITTDAEKEKDIVSVASGEHVIVPEESLEPEAVPESPSAKAPVTGDFFMDKNWLSNENVPKKVFYRNETITHSEWVSRVKMSESLDGLIYADGQEINAKFYLPLLSFDEEFQLTKDIILTNKRRLNGVLAVNGELYDANLKHKIQLRLKKNNISLSHAFQRRDYNYYVDEEAEEIELTKTEYEIKKVDDKEKEAMKQSLPKDSSVEEEEEEEPKGTVRLEWESRLKDNQIYIVRIKNAQGDLILEDMAEENFYLWTPLKQGEFQLEISIRSTATDKILKTTISEISVNMAEDKMDTPSKWRKTLIAAGSSLISSKTKTKGESVDVSGFGPFSLGLEAGLDSFLIEFQGTLFLADIPSENDDKFFNTKLIFGYDKHRVIPLLAHQNSKTIISKNDELNLVNNNMYLLGLGYRIPSKKVELLPFYFYNVGEFTGHQYGIKINYPLPTSLPMSLIFQGEMNDQSSKDIDNDFTQVSLLLGLEI